MFYYFSYYLMKVLVVGFNMWKDVMSFHPTCGHLQTGCPWAHPSLSGIWWLHHASCWLLHAKPCSCQCRGQSCIPGQSASARGPSGSCSVGTRGLLLFWTLLWYSWRWGLLKASSGVQVLSLWGSWCTSSQLTYVCKVSSLWPIKYCKGLCSLSLHTLFIILYM